MTREDLEKVPTPAKDPEPLGVIGAAEKDPQAAAPEDDEDVEARLAYESLMRHRRARRRKRFVTAGVAAGVLAAALLGWAAASSQGGQEQTEVVLQTIPVFREEFSESVQATGTASPLTSVVVTPEIDGIIETVSVSLDDVVAEGEQLLTIRNDDLDREVKQAELDLRQQRRDNAAVQAEYNELYYEACATGDWTLANDKLVELELSRLNLEGSQAAYDQAVARAASRVVKAPASGSVVVMNAVPGAALGSLGSAGGSSGALVQIADLSQMKVSVQVNEVDISQISVGQAARVSFSALPGVVLDGQVTRISTVASSDESGYSYGVVTYDVEVLIPEPVPELKPGMTASVEILLQHVPDALSVPTAALMTDDGVTYYLYVMTDQETQAVERRVVTLGAQSATTAVVDAGLAEGDLVVLDPYAVDPSAVLGEPGGAGGADVGSDVTYGGGADVDGDMGVSAGDLARDGAADDAVPGA